MPVPVQMPLDYSMMALQEGGPHPEIVADVFPWEVFSELEQRYEEGRRKYNLRETRKRRGELRRRRGRPPVCARKLLEVREYELSQCESEEPGAGGAPAFPFLSLLRCFLLAPFYECESSSEHISRELARNPRFSEVCGFTYGEAPSARSLRRFTRVMSEEGLWAEVSRLAVEHNLKERVIPRKPETVAVDTTHHDGFASVKKPTAACRTCVRLSSCPEPVLTCPVTDIVAKSRNYRLPGVKAAILCCASSQIPLCGVAVHARSHDSQTLSPLLSEFRGRHPRLASGIDWVLADGAYAGADNHEEARSILSSELLSPINPGRRKETRRPARGIEMIDARGVPHCIAGHAMVLISRDRVKEQYIWGCPILHPELSDGQAVCAMKGECSPRSSGGRVYRTRAADFPQIAWEHPQHSRRQRKRLRRRTSIERAFSYLKRVFCFERFWGRGEAALQGFIDRYVACFNIAAYVKLRS